MKFLKKSRVIKDPVESKFDAMMSLVKDLPKADYQRLKEAMDLGYASYQKVKNVKTQEEKAIEKELKENSDIDLMEKTLTKIADKEK